MEEAKETVENAVNVEETENKEENKGIFNKKPKKDKEKEKLEEKISKLENDLALEKEKCLRVQAEMINFRKRKDDEVANMYKYANEDILKELLVTLDNFDRALALETEENKDFLKGFHMIRSNIVKIFEENEVSEIVCEGKEFDPALEQAVLTEHVEGVDAGVVLQVLQKGYKYKERVLRAAMVKVSD